MSMRLKYKSVCLNTSEVFYTSTVKNGHYKLETTLMFHNVAPNSTIQEVWRINLEGEEGRGISFLLDLEFSLVFGEDSSHIAFTVGFISWTFCTYKQ